MLKKLGLINVIALLLMGFFCGTAFASPELITHGKVLLEKDEITDIETLFNRAVNNISDIKDSKAVCKAEARLDKGGGSAVLDLEVYSTTQLLKKVETADGKIVLDLATTTFALYSQSREGWSEAGGLKAYSTVYYEIVKDDVGIEYYKLPRVTGGWQRYDSTYSLSGREVRVALIGWPLGGGAPTTGQNIYYYPGSDNTFSYYTPSSWKPASPNAGAAGCTTYVKIDRFGEVWSLTLNNNLASLL